MAKITLGLTALAAAQRYGTMPVPASNPLTPGKVALGKQLFSDPRLSADQSLSCASCHNPATAFADHRKVSSGVYGRQGARNVPTLIGRGYGTLQFWDGRAANLEEQVMQPIVNPLEMGASMETVLSRLRPAYPTLTAPAIADALASYVRSIQSVDAPYDRYMAGETAALSDFAKEGLRLFEDKARCYTCHGGDFFTDESFHNTGVSWRDGRLADEGRARFTGKRYHMGAFKTPTLREIANTAPYMHDGSIATLEEVVDHYAAGGRLDHPNKTRILHRFSLTDMDRRDLVEFLKSLTDEEMLHDPRWSDPWRTATPHQ